MYKQFEGFFTGYKDIKLHYQKWEPENHKGTLIITHGQAEHSDCYHRVIKALENSGWLIWAWDWRGHGKSEGIRGYADDFNDYCNDFECFLNNVYQDKKTANKPVVLLGHSMGGLIQLKTLLTTNKWPVTAQVLSSPLLGIAVEVPAYKEIGAAVLSILAPKVTLGNEIVETFCSMDPEVIKEYKKDPLRHNKISSKVYLGSKIAMSYCHERANKISIPTLMQIPEVDPIVSSPAAMEFFHKIHAEQKELKIYKNRRHEIYNDLGREEAFSDLLRFLKGVVS